MNPSPLRYPGGKYKLYKYVSELEKKINVLLILSHFAAELRLLLNCYLKA